MVARLAPPPWRDRLRVPALIVLLVLAGAIAFYWQWAMAPRAGSADIRAAGIIREIAPVESSYGPPEAHLRVELASGSVAVVNTDMALLWRCRVGDRIDLVGSRTNAGSVRWRLAPAPCG